MSIHSVDMMMGVRDPQYCDPLPRRVSTRPKTRTRLDEVDGARAPAVSSRRASRTMGRESKPADVITREYTINLGKAITGVTFKKRAPRAVAAVRARSRARDETLEWMRDATRERARTRARGRERDETDGYGRSKCARTIGRRARGADARMRADGRMSAIDD